jgi:diaminopimelate epimerase
MKYLEKWHSLGNNFLISKFLPSNEEIKRLCDVNFGIGADQFVFIDYKKVAFYNPDGTEAELCGNALKCVAKIISAESGQDKFTLETKTKKIEIEITKDGMACINLGKPAEVKQITENEFFVNIGNPHYIFFLNNFEGDFFNSNEITAKLNAEGLKKQIEFEQTSGINVSFALVCKNGDLLVRTFERGVGETLSCGSGSTACFTAYVVLYPTLNEVRVFNKGSKKILAFEENFHCISFDGDKNLILKGKGTKVANIEI